MPTLLFSQLEASWKKAVPDLDCTTDANFCESHQACDDIEKNLSPVGFLISGAHSVGDTVFEISAGQYLYQAEGKCQFAITENRLDQFNNKNFIFGQLFLRHFYTVYNYENEQISLGINRASSDYVRMMGHAAWLHQGSGTFAD